jgi:hypothetical protein
MNGKYPIAERSEWKNIDWKICPWSAEGCRHAGKVSGTINRHAKECYFKQIKGDKVCEECASEGVRWCYTRADTLMKHRQGSHGYSANLE